MLLHRHRIMSTPVRQQLYFCITGLLISHTLSLGSNRLESSLLGLEDNNVISPWSLISTLVPLQIGADHETRKELNDIIGNYRNYTRTPSLGTSLTALFTSVQILQRYKTEVTKNSPNTLIQERFNFTDDNIRLINDLIEKETKGLIKDVIRPGQLSPDTSMIVMNAFYFKGQWRSPFSETLPIPFDTLVNGKAATVQTIAMFQRNSYYTADVPELQSRVLEIPYATKPNSVLTTVMKIILPDEKYGLSKLMEKLATFDLKTIRLKLGEVDLYLPKFKIESEVVIDSGVAKKIGLSNTFSDEANLSKLSDTKLRVDKIISKTMIDVNQDGTEGASGTSAFVVPLSGLVYDSFVVDHPFVFYIYEGPNILFTGTVSNINETTLEAENSNESFEPVAEVVGFKDAISATTTPGEKWWIHTGKPEYLIPSPNPTHRFQQPEPKHPTGIRFPFPLSDPTTKFVINSHLQNQSSLNNTV